MTQDYFKSPLNCSADLPKCVFTVQTMWAFAFPTLCSAIHSCSQTYFCAHLPSTWLSFKETILLFTVTGERDRSYQTMAVEGDLDKGWGPGTVKLLFIDLWVWDDLDSKQVPRRLASLGISLYRQTWVKTDWSPDGPGSEREESVECWWVQRPREISAQCHGASGLQRKYHELSDLCLVLTNRHHLTGLSPLDCVDLQFFPF